ncbi:ABC transporter, membrane spanning protein [Candidatus Rhodobacter oscarellae]|uniref:ABC transporter, membrane spanning protein n=1 Tax=Candidatus Rhodobacter oscarellae TaxID=1675527 RepID=A0A0J9E311_9RHOB|nr:ABC transporter, membrane spanning protein [Candidatus Rhodobacter lobularis]
MFLFPIYWFYITSLKGPKEIDRFPPALWPEEPTLNILRVIAEANVAQYLSNSLIIATGISLLTMGLGVGASWALVRIRGKWIDAILITIVVLQMLPAALMATPLYVIFSNLFLLDTRAAVVIAASAKSIPFVIILLRPSFLKIPKEVIEAAAVDGCTGWRLFRFIAFPLVRNSVIIIFALIFMQAYGEYVFSRSFLNSDGKLPASVGLVTEFFGQYERDVTGAMAFGTIYLTPMLVVFVAIQRKLVSGLTAGAVK